MPIHFIPNDPSVQNVLPMRVVQPRPDRGANRAKLSVQGAVAQGQYQVGTPDFLYWQCREAALASIDAWESIFGTFTRWQAGSTLSVIPDLDQDLNAFYNRSSLSFFHQKVGAKTYFSGASTDVVAHEAGHAFLDAIRPDFWGSSRFEVNAFHEAFGDCMAIITALHDQETRVAILSSVSKSNCVETLAEEISEGISKFAPGINAAAPRRARNSFQWGPQGSLPANGGPGELIFEEHSFAQIFSGCFYDTIVNIFSGMSTSTESNLLVATQIAGKLLVDAVKNAPQRMEYFREVGRFMILADEQANAGANQVAIRDAFQGHGIALGSSLTLAPSAAFAAGAAAPGATKKKGIAKVTDSDLTTSAKKELRSLIGAVSNKLDISSVKLAGQQLQEAIHQRAVSLDACHKKLKGVIASAAQVALIGRSHSALSIVGHVSNPSNTDRDVVNYVKSLVEHGRINFEPTKKSSRSMVASTQASPRGITHEVQEVRGQKTLARIRYVCG